MINPADLYKMLGTKVIIKIPLYNNHGIGYNSEECATGVLSHIRVNTEYGNRRHTDNIEVFLNTGFSVTLNNHSNKNVEIYPATEMGKAIFGE